MSMRSTLKLMKCSRLNLAERTKTARKETRAAITTRNEGPRRYCQRRLINPEHEEDPRWSREALERFRCEISSEEQNKIDEQNKIGNEEELFLSVMNLNFQGDVQQSKRPRTCFKYKSVNNRHRMFIKQIVEDDADNMEESRLSVNPNHYFDEYVKYILNNTEQSRPSTAKSTIDRFMNNKEEENKETQVNANIESQTKTTKDNENLRQAIQSIKNIHKIDEELNTDTKVTYYKTNKRKSLTISRAQSPETVQVIRVDVVCNNISSNSSIISIDDESFKEKLINEPAVKQNLKNNNFASKYLLTNTIKSLDQNICGGSKVTLLCKTFKLADRTRVYKKFDNKKMQSKKHDIAWK